MNIDLYVEDLARQEEPLEGDASEIEQILGNHAMKRTLGLLMQEVNGRLNSLSTIDFTQPSATLVAAETQGRIAGMRRIFDIFIEVIEKENTNGRR